MLTIEYLRGKNKYIQENFEKIIERLNNLERAKGIMQHHDAITGTSYNTTIKNWKELLLNASKPAD